MSFTSGRCSVPKSTVQLSPQRATARLTSTTSTSTCTPTPTRTRNFSPPLCALTSSFIPYSRRGTLARLRRYHLYHPFHPTNPPSSFAPRTSRRVHQTSCRMYVLSTTIRMHAYREKLGLTRNHRSRERSSSSQSSASRTLRFLPVFLSNTNTLPAMTPWRSRTFPCAAGTSTSF